MIKLLLKKLGIISAPPSELEWSMPPLALAKTRFALHSGEGAPGAYHLDMWAPVLRESGAPFCIITRFRTLYNYARKTYAGVPVILARAPEQIEEALGKLPALATVLYPSNTGNNLHLLRFNHLRHVFIGHGDSEKSSSAYKFFRAYDEIWVAGQAHEDRFRLAPFDCGHLRFVKIGRPLLKKLLLANSGRPWPKRFPKPRLLYAPTWEGVYAEQAYSSLDLAPELLGAAAGAGNVGMIYVKLHPLTGRTKPEWRGFEAVLKSSLPDSRLWVHPAFVPAQAVLADANIFVCDVSAMVTECLACFAPVFVYRPPGENNSAKSGMPLEHFAYVFSTVDEFKEKLSAVLRGEDESMAKARLEAAEYYLGKSYTENDAFYKLFEE